MGQILNYFVVVHSKLKHHSLCLLLLNIITNYCDRPSVSVSVSL